jgi:hypothetical protein
MSYAILTGIWEEIDEELHRAINKFPTWPTDIIHAGNVVSEEAGELSKAVLQAVYEPNKSNIEDVRKEAIQTAAMCIRFIRSLDAERYELEPCEQHSQAD